MRFIELTPNLSEEWDKVVHTSDDAWLCHLYNWLQMTEKVWNLESKSFLVEHEGEKIGIFPLQMHKKNRILKSTFMGTGGAAIKNSAHPSFRKKVFRAMYDHVEEIARSSGSPYIEIQLPPLDKSSLHNRWGINPLVNYFYTDVSTHTWMVDLSRPEDVIFANLSENAKRKIKLAKKKGYQIEKLKTLEEVDKYYEVHCENYNRTGANPHPKAYFLGIYENICKKGYAVIWKALDHNGEEVAFKIIGLFKNGAIYWAGCCKTEHLNSGVNYLLHYNSMLWAKNKGAGWFESGEAFPNVREGKLKGLTDFKGKFGGELHRFYRGRLQLIAESEKENVYQDWLRSTALLLQPVLGEKVIKFVGRLLRKIYRFPAEIYQFMKSNSRVNFVKPYWEMTPEEIEEINRKKYKEDYSLAQISLNRKIKESDYSRKMTQIRLELIRKYGHDKRVLDIGCGTGDYLFESKNVISEGAGVDFTKKAIKEAISKKNKMGIKNIEFVICNAKQIPYKEEAFDLIYSYASLYHIPKVEKVIYEVERLLKPNSIAILEFGNLYSLNTIVCKAYPEWAIPCHIKIGDMKAIIKNAGLEIIQWRSFQILPLWGGRPVWLKPLLHTLWRRILQKEIKGRMMDEWISNLPIIKRFTFRQIFICKEAAKNSR